MTGLDGISNVLLFVSDALRFDSLPESIANRGIAFKAIAQSTFSAPSFATLATGRYPQEHGVMAFADSVADTLPTVFDIDGLDATFYQADPEPTTMNNPIYDVLRREETKELAELSPPFVYMERDMTTHMPHDPDHNAPSYLRSRRSDWDTIRREYQQSVDASMARFDERISVLEEEGWLEDTLVILTADHGELLGEYGEVGHEAPMSPELVEVPAVFIHPGLSRDKFETSPEEPIEHVDVVETAIDCLEEANCFATSGKSILKTDRGGQPCYSTIEYPNKSIAFLRHKRAFTKRPYWNFSRYRADGIWWKDGGYALARGSRLRRLWYALWRLSSSPHRYNLRGDTTKVLKSYYQTTTVFGEPPVSTLEAKKIAREIRDSTDSGSAGTVDIGGDAEQQLEDLGYI